MGTIIYSYIIIHIVEKYIRVYTDNRIKQQLFHRQICYFMFFYYLTILWQKQASKKFQNSWKYSFYKEELVERHFLLLTYCLLKNTNKKRKQHICSTRYNSIKRNNTYSVGIHEVKSRKVERKNVESYLEV